MALEFRCADVGVACSKVTEAETEDQLLERVGRHARDAHGVELNDTLVSYALTKVRNVGDGGSRRR